MGEGWSLGCTEVRLGGGRVVCDYKSDVVSPLLRSLALCFTLAPGELSKQLEQDQADGGLSSSGSAYVAAIGW